MAIDVCSEITVVSPRVSFSHDLDRPDAAAAATIHRRLDSSLDSTSDFNFCFTGAGFVHELSSADELFSNGKILPIEIKKISIPARQNRGSVPNSSRRRPSESPEKKMLKEFLSSSYDAEDEDGDEEKPAQAKAFWQFKRSSSLNCDNSGGKSLIRSLHFLSRSNSTGSVPNPKESLQKQQSVSSRKSSSSSSSSSSQAYYPYRPALRKCGSEGNGVRVLNLPPPYISRATVNLFGFGSIFCNGKFKSKKKKK